MGNINVDVAMKIKKDLSSCYEGDNEILPLYIETAAYAAAMKMAELKDTAFSNFMNTLRFDVRQQTNTIGLSRRLLEKTAETKYYGEIATATKNIEELVDNSKSTDEFFEQLPFCQESKNDELAKKENDLLKFMQWLEKRGFIKEDLSYDTEHQVHTFATQFLNNVE